MRLQIISEPLDIFHWDEFLDPLGTSFKFDSRARETVGWRRRRDPPKESFFVDDERDGFACRQQCSSISLRFLVCHHCPTLHRGPPCEGLHRIQDGAPCTTPGPCPVCADDPGSPPRSAVVQGGEPGSSLLGMGSFSPYGWSRIAVASASLYSNARAKCLAHCL